MENLILLKKEDFENLELQLSEIKALIKQKNQEQVNNTWLTKQEAKSRLKCCMKTLEKYINKGLIPYSRYAAKIYIRSADIEAFLNQNYIK